MSSKPDTRLHYVLRSCIRKAPAGQPFILASGQTSAYFIDCKPALLGLESLAVITDALIYELCHKNAFATRHEMRNAHHIAAVALGGCSMAVSLALKYREYCSRYGYVCDKDEVNSKNIIFVRKESKDHGTKTLVEGCYLRDSGQGVILLEDVITTGGSTLRACKQIEKVGLKIVRIVALVDRQQGGRNTIEAQGYKLTTLTTVDELL